MVANTTASKKQKGRKFQQLVAGKIREEFNLPDLDVVSTSMGAGGVDIKLSALALATFPYSVECKFNERAGPMYKWYDQACYNTYENSEPLLVVKASRQKPLAIVDLDYFLKLANKAGVMLDKV